MKFSKKVHHFFTICFLFIEIDRRWIEFLRNFVLKKQQNIQFKQHPAVQGIIQVMKELSNGKTGKLGLESQRQSSCANRCFQALVEYDYISQNTAAKIQSVSSDGQVINAQESNALEPSHVFKRAKVIIAQYIQLMSGGGGTTKTRVKIDNSDIQDSDEDLSMTLDTISRVMLCLKKDRDIDSAIELYPHLVGLIPYATDNLRFQLCSTLLEFQSLFPT